MSEANQSATESASPDGLAERESEVKHDLGGYDLAVIAGGIILTFLVVQAIGLYLASNGSVDLVLTHMTGESAEIEGKSGASVPIAATTLVLVQTALILVLLRFGSEKIIKAMFLYGAWGIGVWAVVLLFGYNTTTLVAGCTFGAGIALALWKIPKWYVLNTVAILWAGIAVGIGGMIATPLPVVVLLLLFLVYDAIAVYRTAHMQEMAKGVAGLKLPVMVVYPLSWTFSLSDNISEITDQKAMVLGAGDLVIPSVLVASAAAFSPAEAIHIGSLAVNIPAIGAATGTILGVIALLNFRGSVHAGLPPLNIGAVVGYASACLVISVPLFPA